MSDTHARAPGDGPAEVDGIKVAPPLTVKQARILLGEGLLADDREGLARVWERITYAWDQEIERVRREIREDRLQERVAGEWSLVETLRHLVFVTDVWVGARVLGSSRNDRLGLPPHFVTNGGDLGLDLDAVPSLDEVLTVRKDRHEMVRSAITESGDLDQVGTGGPPDFTILGVLQVVAAEEWFHLGFARRDLAALQGT